ncbi:2Fe-2S iron-sulfur cluster-binding protein [Streptomyces sp. NPDC005301]|uniref:2Fe-2S iron-sulfur cluster-binding protein n=1 Tax=Streptomyces sp. NPDC005301 TaxID=3156874 RepID=UPI0033BC927C
MTDDQHGEDAPRGGTHGAWERLPQGDYDDGATAFVKLPEGGMDALLAERDSPLAAPGHGYVPPQITVTPATTAGTDPAATGSWAVPAEGVQWPDPNAVPQEGAHDGFSYRPGATGQWTFADAEGSHAAEGQQPSDGASYGHEPAGHDVTGQWSIPVAGGDLPDESGEFTTSSLVEQWGGTPPATLPGGAAAPWATETVGEPWFAGPREHAPDASAGTAAEAPGEAPGGSYPGATAQAAQEASERVHEAAEAAEAVAREGYGRDGHEDARRGAEADAHPYETAEDGPATAPHGHDTGAPGPGAAADGHATGAHAHTTAPQDHETVPHGHETQGRGFEAAGPEFEAGGRTRETAEFAPDTGPESAGPETTGTAYETSPSAPVTSETPDAAGPDAAPAERSASEDTDTTDTTEAPAPAHDEHPMSSYVLRVNGADRPVTDAWIGESLLYVLRERLGLAGAKDGCSQGECGACNVQVDGRLVASCLVPAVTAASSEVRTVEGLAADGQPSDVQRALAKCGAVQCGFCIPGMAMTVHDLLEGNPAPTELEARQALCGNLCRCSGYRGVLDAVREVVAEREAHSANGDQDGDEARIPHQAGPGDGGVNRSAFEPATPHDQPYGQDGGQA